MLVLTLEAKHVSLDYSNHLIKYNYETFLALLPTRAALQQGRKLMLFRNLDSCSVSSHKMKSAHRRWTTKIRNCVREK